MASDTLEIRKALKRHHRASGSWAITGREALRLSPSAKGVAFLIATGRRLPTPRQVAHYREVFLPTLQFLPDPKDTEAVADAVLREMMAQLQGITAKELARRLLVPVYRVRQVVRLLRGAAVRICPGRRGYCLPSTYEQGEAAIRLLERRRDGLTRTIDLLRGAQRKAFVPIDSIGTGISHSPLEVVDVD